MAGPGVANAKDDLTGERLRAVFDRAPLGICALDPEGRILGANLRLRRMLDLSSEASRPVLFDLVHHDDAEILRAALRRLTRHGAGQVAVERRFRGPDGGLFWGRLSAAPASPVAGDGRFVVATLEDVEGRRRLEAAIEEVNDHVEALSRA